jgi:hypothetical protein
VKVAFKPTKAQLIAGGVAVALAFGLMANRSPGDDQSQSSGTLDAPARQACDDFAAGYPDARTKPERLALADRVMMSTRRTGNEAIRDEGTALGIGAGESPTAWRSSAKAFTNACHAAGWVAP